MARIVFVDTETTGLDPERHEIWEVALIVREDATPEPDGYTTIDGAGHVVAHATGPPKLARVVDTEHVWQLPIDEGRADLIALNVGQFHDRYKLRFPLDSSLRAPEADELLRTFARSFADLTWGAHLVGAVVSFDEQRLRRLLVAHGVCPGWHYHLIDIEALAVGYLAGRFHADPADRLAQIPGVPWKSEDLSRAVDVDPDEFPKHTALGDAQWARAIYDKVMAWVA